MKIYENVIIGNFLYSLGLSLGLQKNTSPAIINLLQQTPSDKLLGDLLVEYPGVVRLIEFKNKASSLDKEVKKLERIKEHIDDKLDMIEVSREIHWYIETEPTESVVYNRIVQYLDAFDKETFGIYTIETFIANMIDEIIYDNNNLNFSKVKDYLDLIAMCKVGGGKGGTGGLIINVTEKGVRYVQISDFSQLRLQHKEFVEEIEKLNETVMQLERNMQQKLEKERHDYQGMSL